MRGLKEYAREMGANGVIGIKITTCTHGFNNGSYMYMTFTGTAVELETP
nr:heavy metal-binding domain-containing protein [Wohlfahrtiimonas chitiniclastica]